MTSFSIFRQHLKNSSKDLNTFENIMENGACFWSKCSIFHNIFKQASKGVIMEKRVKVSSDRQLEPVTPGLHSEPFIHYMTEAPLNYVVAL